MNSSLKNFLVLIVSIIIGSMINMAIVMLSSTIISPPAGTDTSTIEGLKKALPLFTPKHFLFPFLAHALGTFFGALFAYKFSNKNPKLIAMLVGFIFLIFGSINVYTLPAPMWFNALDLVGAYIPMAYLALFVSKKK